MQTIRKQMIVFLNKKEMSAGDLCQAVGFREKEVYEHLSLIARSIAAQGKKINIRPFRCLECEYVFQGRMRFTHPGRCPPCKKVPHSRANLPGLLTRKNPSLDQ